MDNHRYFRISLHAAEVFILCSLHTLLVYLLWIAMHILTM